MKIFCELRFEPVRRNELRRFELERRDEHAPDFARAGMNMRQIKYAPE
jgi:hypothetical protein